MAALPLPCSLRTFSHAQSSGGTFPGDPGGGHCPRHLLGTVISLRPHLILCGCARTPALPTMQMPESSGLCHACPTLSAAAQVTTRHLCIIWGAPQPFGQSAWLSRARCPLPLGLTPVSRAPKQYFFACCFMVVLLKTVASITTL